MPTQAQRQRDWEFVAELKPEDGRAKTGAPGLEASTADRVFLASLPPSASFGSGDARQSPAGGAGAEATFEPPGSGASWEARGRAEPVTGWGRVGTPAANGIELTTYQPSGATTTAPAKPAPTAPGQMPGGTGGGGPRSTSGPKAPATKRTGTPQAPSDYERLELRPGLAAQRFQSGPARPAQPEKKAVPRGRVDGSDGSLVQDYFKRDIHRPRTGPELTRDYAFGFLGGQKADEKRAELVNEVLARAQRREIPLPAQYTNEAERREGRSVYPLMDQFDFERVLPKFNELNDGERGDRLDLFTLQRYSQSDANYGTRRTPLQAMANRKIEAILQAARQWKYFPEWARKQGKPLTRVQLATYAHAAAARTLEQLHQDGIDNEVLKNLAVLYVTNELTGALGPLLDAGGTWLASQMPTIARLARGLTAAAEREAPTLTAWAKGMARFTDAKGAMNSGFLNATTGLGIQQLEDPQASFQQRLDAFGHNFAGGALFHSGLHGTGVVGGRWAAKRAGRSPRCEKRSNAGGRGRRPRLGRRALPSRLPHRPAPQPAPK